MPCRPIIHAAARSVRRHARRYAAHYAIAAPVGCTVLTPFVWLAVRPAVGAFAPAPVPGVVDVPEPNTLALFGASVALAVVVKVWSAKRAH